MPNTATYIQREPLFSCLYLFISPHFPGRVSSISEPEKDLRGGYWKIDPYQSGTGHTVPRTVWLAGRRNFCDLRFHHEALSRVHFTVLYEPIEGNKGRFGILSGGQYPDKEGEMEYHASSLGVWVYDAAHNYWKKAAPGEPADRIDPENAHSLWLGVPDSALIVAKSSDMTINTQTWSPSFWPKPEDRRAAMISPTVSAAIENQIKENQQAAESKWTVIRDWGEWLQATPQNAWEWAWKFPILIMFGFSGSIGLYFLIRDVIGAALKKAIGG